MFDRLRVDGDEREDEATAVGLTIAGIHQTVELALLAALNTAVRRGLPLGAVTILALKRLKNETAAILVKAEQRVQRAFEAAGIPFDYQPVIPVPAPPPAETASISVANRNIRRPRHQRRRNCHHHPSGQRHQHPSRNRNRGRGRWR
jgi:hypothetical protein